MRIFFPSENPEEEPRVPIIPGNVGKYAALGLEVVVEAGMGCTLGLGDEAYKETGATLVAERDKALSAADVVMRLRMPPAGELEFLKKGALHISYLDPFNERELVEKMALQGVTAVSMEMIPRTTVAQKMDALSSQANLGGYVAVLLAAERLDRIFPMMMTPSGTISPARVFVIGAGVAGLQAIATAKRLGARVEAFDTRPVVEEQVASLGAKFVKVDLGETGQTAQGYARQLTDDQLARQREAMASHCASADVVITTAQVFGRRAPRIITSDMVKAMKPGSIVVDMAVETGGNVEGSVAGEAREVDGVRILGMRNLPGRVAQHASQMYSNNLLNFFSHFWDGEAGEFKLNLEDEILRGCVITHGGEIINAAIAEHYKEEK